MIRPTMRSSPVKSDFCAIISVSHRLAGVYSLWGCELVDKCEEVYMVLENWPEVCERGIATPARQAKTPKGVVGNRPENVAHYGIVLPAHILPASMTAV